MYDAGGISLKPSDAMHAAMKLDMSGSAAILGAMTTLRDLGCRTAVTGWLMCTDNMPSGTATRLGDVLTTHSGKTIEVINADAEGRLVMADGIDMAVEEGADAIVTVATLTGAAMRTFGTAGAAMMANRPELGEQLSAAGTATDELVWELPFIRRYRPQIDSAIADVKNMGGENAGDDHRGPLPGGLHRGGAVRVPRHLRTDDDRGRRLVAIHRCHGIRHAAPRRVRVELQAAGGCLTNTQRNRRRHQPS